jgi:hypothetical protein
MPLSQNFSVAVQGNAAGVLATLDPLDEDFPPIAELDLDPVEL